MPNSNKVKITVLKVFHPEEVFEESPLKISSVALSLNDTIIEITITRIPCYFNLRLHMFFKKTTSLLSALTLCSRTK